MADEDIRFQVDRAARRFLAAVEWNGGEATTSQIRARSGLGKDETQYRFKRLDDLDLINVRYADESYGGRNAPKIATLTGKARREIERGLLYDIREPETQEQGEDILAELKQLNETTDRLEKRLNVIADGQTQVKQMLDAIEYDLDWLEDYTIKWTVAEQEYIQAIAALLEQELAVDIDEALDRVD